MRYLLVLIMICVSGCKIFIPTNKNISTNLENESNEALLYTIKIVKPINSNLTAVPFEINYTGRWTIASRYINPYTNKKLHIFGVDFNNGDIVSRFPNFVNKSRNNQIYGFFAFPGVSKNQYGILTPDYDYGEICTLYNSMDKKLPNNIDVLDIDYDVNGKMEYKLLSNKLKTEALFNLVIWPQSKISLVINGNCELVGIDVSSALELSKRLNRTKSKIYELHNFMGPPKPNWRY